MAQPHSRVAELEAPGEATDKWGRFWVSNPWKFPSEGKNLSSYERNMFFLNSREGRVFDIGSVSQADSLADSRSAIAVDIDRDGMQELVVRSTGGGSIMVFHNRFPQRNWVTIKLEGTKSNRHGLGARLIAEYGGRKVVRELQAQNTFRSQSPAEAHFGLGDASQIDRLEIAWPSGNVQRLSAIPQGRVITIREGTDGFVAAGGG